MAALRAETRYAKQLFLYGAGDGVPVRSVPRLAEMSGVHEQTIRRNLPKWEKEAEAMLSGTSECGLALQLSAKQLQEHENDMNHLRDQLNQVKFESEKLEEISARLLDFMENFDDESDRNYALRVFENWCAAAGARSTLRSQFLALQKQWTSLSGIVDLKDIAAVREKEMQKGKAKLEIKKLENQPMKIANPLDNSVFARPRISSGES